MKNVLTSSFVMPNSSMLVFSMLSLAIFSLLIFLPLSLTPVEAQVVIAPPRLTVLINQEVFVPGDIMVTYGKAFPNDSLVVRIFDPAGRAVAIETIRADSNGTFTAQVFTWPEPSRNFVFGRYTVEVSSSVVPSYKETRTVSFSDVPSPSLNSQAGSSILSVKLDSPTEISVGQSFRIFVQVTFDGALVNVSDPNELLSSSHIHSGNTTINLTGKFNKLHEGLYYADVQLDRPGSYIIHAIAFNKGFLAHDSKVVSSGSSIGEIQDTVNTLKDQLESTSQELNDTRQAVEEAREAIRQDIGRAESAVDELQQASGQINSIIIPILALISIIIALQISLFARIRASFK